MTQEDSARSEIFSSLIAQQLLVPYACGSGRESSEWHLHPGLRRAGAAFVRHHGALDRAEHRDAAAGAVVDPGASDPANDAVLTRHGEGEGLSDQNGVD